MPRYCRQVGAILRKDTILSLRAWYFSVISIVAPVLCIWFLASVTPRDIPAVPSPPLYDASFLDPAPCLEEPESYSHCFQLLYYPNCQGFEAEPSSGDCRGLTNHAIRHIVERYEERGTTLHVCNYSTQNPDVSAYGACQVLGFRDATAFDTFAQATGFWSGQVRAVVGVGEEAFFHAIDKNAHAEVPGLPPPIEWVGLDVTVLYNNTADHEHPENMRIPASVTNMVHEGLLDGLWNKFMAENDYKYDPDPTSAYAEDTRTRMRLGFFPSVAYYDKIIDTISSGAPIILAISIALNYVAQAYFVVSEKVTGNRRMLHAIGLRGTVFLVAKGIVSLVRAAVLALVVLISIVAMGFEWRQTADLFVTYITFFLFYIASEAFILLILTLFNSVNGALCASVLLLFALLIGEMLHVVQIPTLFSETPGDEPAALCPANTTSDVLQMIFWFPTNLAAALAQIGDYSVSKIDETSGQPITPPGFSFAMAFHDNPPAEAPFSTQHWCFPVYVQWGCLVVNIIFYLALAYYLDNLLPFVRGKSAGPLFCLRRCCPVHRPIRDAQRAPLEEWDQDVRHEAEVVEDTLKEGAYKDGILVTHLFKAYGATRNLATSTKVVVNNLCLMIPSNSIFGLLGPNGAGKTTTIRMLTGQLTRTAGNFTYFGEDPEAESIRTRIGICPQHDVLYAGLSCLEHIRLYLAIKDCSVAAELVSNARRRETAKVAGIGQGIGGWARRVQQRNARRNQEVAEEPSSPEPSSAPEPQEPRGWREKKREQKRQIRELAREYLSAVNLAPSLFLCPGELSGGMRRRLSIVLALSASPLVVFMDEPTTGLDPVSKRVVWECIIREKQDKCIVLTTHSMEEADILADRIGIMARGSLRCLGSSAHLKRIYGMGFRLDIETQFDVERGLNFCSRVKSEIVDRFCPDAVLIGRTGGHLTLALPREMTSDAVETLAKQLEASSRATDGPPLVIDWALGHTTLEEVFLAIARYAEKQYNRKLIRQLRGGE